MAEREEVDTLDIPQADLGSAMAMLSRIAPPGMTPLAVAQPTGTQTEVRQNVAPQAAPPANQTPVPQQMQAPQQQPQPQPQAQPQAQPPPPVAQPPQRPQLDLTKIADRFSKPAEAAAPAAPPASIDALPETPAVGPDGKPDAKSAHAYAQLRSTAKRYEKEIVPALEQAKAAEAAARKVAEDKVAVILAEKEKLEAEKVGLVEQVGRLSLVESPQFQEKYGSRETAIRDKLATALSSIQRVEPAQAEAMAARLLRMSSDPEALGQMIADFHPRAAGAVEFAAQEFAALDQERGQELANWRQSGLASGVQEAREAVIRSAEDRRKMATDALEFARGAGNPFLNHDPMDTEAAAQTTSLSDAFQGFVQTASEDQLVKAAAEGFTAPLLYEQIERQRTEIEALQAQVQSFRGAYRVPASSFLPSWAPPPVQPASPAATPAVDSDDAELLLRNRLTSMIPRGPGQ